MGGKNAALFAWLSAALPGRTVVLTGATGGMALGPDGRQLPLLLLSGPVSQRSTAPGRPPALLADVRAADPLSERELAAAAKQLFRGGGAGSTAAAAAAAEAAADSDEGEVSDDGEQLRSSDGGSSGGAGAGGSWC